MTDRTKLIRNASAVIILTTAAAAGGHYGTDYLNKPSLQINATGDSSDHILTITAERGRQVILKDVRTIHLSDDRTITATMGEPDLPLPPPPLPIPESEFKLTAPVKVWSAKYPGDRAEVKALYEDILMQSDDLTITQMAALQQNKPAGVGNKSWTAWTEGVRKQLARLQTPPVKLPPTDKAAWIKAFAEIVEAL